MLVRYFKYSPEIQKNIEEKKLQDQMVFTNQAAARAAKEEAELKKIIQEGMVITAVEMEKGNAYVTRKIAEKDLYVRKKKAEADLLVKLAEAERVRLKNDALKGVGSERMVGLKMADVYKGLDVIILPSDGPNGVNPLDLDNALKLFDVRQRRWKMKRFFIHALMMAAVLSRRLCSPYHRRNRSGGPDPQAGAFRPKRAWKTVLMRRDPHIFFFPLSMTGMCLTPSCRTWK